MSMFSRRHYLEVADTIGLTLRQLDRDDSKPHDRYIGVMAVHALTDNLVTTFKKDSGRFKEDVFNTRIGLIRREGLQS